MIHQNNKFLGFLFSLFLLIGINSFSQNKRKSNFRTYDKVSLNDFNFRNIGPAFLSGRIADIAIDPNNENIWYVAVGSGGVWKTQNSGTTWIPLFDEENSYSTAVDPVRGLLFDLSILSTFSKQ